MNTTQSQNEMMKEERESDEQKALLKAFTGTVFHFFGGWQAIFKGVGDGRNPELSTYPLEGVLSTGVLMFLFRLGARRQINHNLRGNAPSQAKFGAWFGVEEVPHGDTL